MLGVGLMGYAMRVYDFPIAPVLIGLILGPQAETQLRRALAISQGDASALFNTPLAVGLWLVAAALLFLPILLRRLRT
jgi:putative tricarboxylic transport membrane protein